MAGEGPFSIARAPDIGISPPSKSGSPSNERPSIIFSHKESGSSRQPAAANPVSALQLLEAFDFEELESSLERSLPAAKLIAPKTRVFSTPLVDSQSDQFPAQMTPRPNAVFVSRAPAVQISSTTKAKQNVPKNLRTTPTPKLAQTQRRVEELKARFRESETRFGSVMQQTRSQLGAVRSSSKPTGAVQLTHKAQPSQTALSRVPSASSRASSRTSSRPSSATSQISQTSQAPKATPSQLHGMRNNVLSRQLQIREPLVQSPVKPSLQHAARRLSAGRAAERQNLAAYCAAKKASAEAVTLQQNHLRNIGRANLAAQKVRQATPQKLQTTAHPESRYAQRTMIWPAETQALVKTPTTAEAATANFEFCLQDQRAPSQKKRSEKLEKYLQEPVGERLFREAGQRKLRAEAAKRAADEAVARVENDTKRTLSRRDWNAFEERQRVAVQKKQDAIQRGIDLAAAIPAKDRPQSKVLQSAMNTQLRRQPYAQEVQPQPKPTHVIRFQGQIW